MELLKLIKAESFQSVRKRIANLPKKKRRRFFRVCKRLENVNDKRRRKEEKNSTSSVNIHIETL